MQFVRIACASGAELETEILIAEKLGFGKKDKLEKIKRILEEEMKMLHVMIGKLRT